MSQGFEALTKRIGEEVQLRSTKIDGAPHFDWTCRIVDASPETVVLYQAAGTPINTWQTLWAPDCDARVYFWRGRGYNVIRSSNADGSLRDYYCNVITPARVVGDELRWDDLDLDVSVQADGAYRILDEAEWARNAKRLNVAPGWLAHARRSLVELVTAIERRAFPFDALAVSPYAMGH